jgi:LemA protein
MGVGAIVGIVFGVIFLILLIGVGILVGIYNTLVGLRNAVKNAWSNIDVQLKRRHDLIPNLVETVKGYAAHEKQTLTDVIQARNLAVAAVGKGASVQIPAENNLNGAISRLLAVAEAYPNLRANENFIQLQNQLAQTEDQLSLARQIYNDSVMQYNNQVQMFPSNIVAGMFHFAAEAFYEVEQASDREVPAVKF